MSDNAVQSETRKAAARTAALLFAIVLFAAIWEADSNRSQPGQIASEIGPPALNPSSSGKPIEIGNRPASESPINPVQVELDRTLTRQSGLVRIRLQLEPVSSEDSDSQAQLSELVCEGQIHDLRRELLALLKELDETSEIVPASATTSEKSDTSHRGFIFLSRRPESVATETPVAIDSSSLESQESSKPELLDSSVRIGIR